MLVKGIKHIFVLLALATFSTGSVVLAAETTPESIDGTTLITAEKLIDLVSELPDMVIIDARKSSDRAKGYIEGSIGLPNTETNPAALAKYLPTKETPVCFFCNGEKCGRSVESAKIAVKEGYSKVFWFRGGWDEWSGKGLPAMKD